MYLRLRLYSYADLTQAWLLQRIGRAFDAEPELRPRRVDLQDWRSREPLRGRVRSVAQYLVGEHSAAGRQGFRLEADIGSEGDGGFDYFAYLEPGPPHELTVHANSLRDPGWLKWAHWEAMARLFVRLAGAFDAAYGYATDVDLLRQYKSEMSAAGFEVDWLDESMREDSLDDVYWLNHFGPALREFWGDRLKGLGTQQDETANGGVVVWAQASPWLYRPVLASAGDYPWKHPFYEALGRDTFRHPGQPPGQYLPAVADHIRCLLPPQQDLIEETGVSPMELEEPPPAWLAEKVAALRQLSFFSDYGSDEAAAADIAADHPKWGAQPPGDALVDLEIAEHDRDRVWWDDTEADVCAGNKVYVETLKEWARISRGAFKPKHIRERWLGETGPISVRMDVDGREVELKPRYEEDYLDLRVLATVNSVIGKSPYRFYVYEPFDQSAFIVALTKDEKRALERRGWRFV